MIGNIRAVAAVCDHFQKYDRVGLVLPDGWFGRPYDNLLSLTSVEGSSNAMRIGLDDDLFLDFHGPVEVASTMIKVVISAFEKLIWTWHESDTGTAHTEKFTDGDVKFLVDKSRMAALLV